MNQTVLEITVVVDADMPTLRKLKHLLEGNGPEHGQLDKDLVSAIQETIARVDMAETPSVSLKPNQIQLKSRSPGGLNANEWLRTNRRPKPSEKPAPPPANFQD